MPMPWPGWSAQVADEFFHTERIIRQHRRDHRQPAAPARTDERDAGRAGAGPVHHCRHGRRPDHQPGKRARYTPYVKIAEAVDAKKLVGLYVRLYPLFQESYEKLGYPKKYFNDRLIVVLDNLLAAPNIKEPVKLVQPNVFYLYADPDLEKRSIGQRILMRTGSKNEAKIKAKLREINRTAAHMRDKKVVSAG
jgi:hypothetical protein